MYIKFSHLDVKVIQSHAHKMISSSHQLIQGLHRQLELIGNSAKSPAGRIVFIKFTFAIVFFSTSTSSWSSSAGRSIFKGRNTMKISTSTTSIEVMQDYAHVQNHVKTLFLWGGFASERQPAIKGCREQY